MNSVSLLIYDAGFLVCLFALYTIFRIDTPQPRTAFLKTMAFIGSFAYIAFMIKEDHIRGLIGTLVIVFLIWARKNKYF